MGVLYSIYNKTDNILKIISSKYWYKNVFSMLRKSGVIVFPNGYRLRVSGNSFRDILQLYFFSVRYGVKIGETWKVDLDSHSVITPDGIKLSLRALDPLIFAETFLYDVHFLDFDLTGKTVIHAGAYVGETALYYASKGAEVYAFEPQPECYRIALLNLDLNPELREKITIRDWAIGTDGEVEFPDVGCNGGVSAYGNAQRRTKVRSVSISTVLKEFDIKRPNILDLDVKGAEFLVVNDEVLKEFDVIRIEYSTAINGKILGTIGELIGELRGYGFNKFRVYKHNEERSDLSEHGTLLASK